MRTEPNLSKYKPLQNHLERQGRDRIRMSFAEIEKVIANRLPPSARKHRPWWSNNPTNSVITYAWLAAGYKTAQVDMADETLVFVKSHQVPPSAHQSLFGCLKGDITIDKSVDLTVPIFPIAAWEKDMEEKWDRLYSSSKDE